MQHQTLNLRIVTGTGGFTVAWFVDMFENLTKMVCLIWKFSRGGWRRAFLPGNTKWRTNCYRLCSSIKNAHFKDFWILILQYNNSLRARYAKIEAKSKYTQYHRLESDGGRQTIWHFYSFLPRVLALWFSWVVQDETSEVSIWKKGNALALFSVGRSKKRRFAIW